MHETSEELAALQRLLSDESLQVSVHGHAELFDSSDDATGARIIATKMFTFQMES